MVSATSGFLIVILTFYLGWKYINYYGGVIATLIILTSRPLFYIYSSILAHNFKSAELDSFFTLFFFLSFFSFLKIKQNKKYFYIAILFSSIAFMIKGFLAFLPLTGFFIFQLINPKNKFLTLNAGTWLAGMGIFLILILPWHIYEYLKYGQKFIDGYIVFHFIKRFFIPLEGHRENFNYYFVYLFDPKNYIWGMALLISIVFKLINKRWFVFLFNFLTMFNILFILLFYSIAQTKLYWYISPIYPFAALLIASQIARIVKKLKNKTQI